MPSAARASTISTPGRKPPTNSWRMSIWAITPYMMIGRAGGNSRPMLPADVSSPMLNRSR